MLHFALKTVFDNHLQGTSFRLTWIAICYTLLFLRQDCLRLIIQASLCLWTSWMDSRSLQCRFCVLLPGYSHQTSSCVLSLPVCTTAAQVQLRIQSQAQDSVNAVMASLLLQDSYLTYYYLMFLCFSESTLILWAARRSHLCQLHSNWRQSRIWILLLSNFPPFWQDRQILQSWSDFHFCRTIQGLFHHLLNRSHRRCLCVL